MCHDLTNKTHYNSPHHRKWKGGTKGRRGDGKNDKKTPTVIEDNLARETQARAQHVLENHVEESTRRIHPSVHVNTSVSPRLLEPPGNLCALFDTGISLRSEEDGPGLGKKKVRLETKIMKNTIISVGEIVIQQKCVTP